MATVRFSKELQEQIIFNAIKVGSPAVERAKATKPDLGDRFYDIIFKDSLEHLKQLPSEWFGLTDDIVVETSNSDDITFTLPRKRPWPEQLMTVNGAETHKYRTGRVKLNRDAPQFADLFAEVDVYITACKAAEAKQDEYVAMVKKLITTYSTLAPALKAWPALWDLIPDSYKDKHRTVVAREKKEVELELDFNRMTAMTAAAKFGA